MGHVTHHGPIGVRMVGNLDCGSGGSVSNLGHWQQGCVCKSTHVSTCYSTDNVKWLPARWGFYSFRICTALLLFPQAPRSLSCSLDGGAGPMQVAHAPLS